MRPIVLVALIASILAPAAPRAANDVPARPNIVIILADDLGHRELGCYGQQKIRTPHLDRLAAEGQRWTQFYSGAPVCAPSRNVLLTGRHTGGCAVPELKRANPGETLTDLRGDWPLPADTHTIARALRQVGYTTACFGKWGMGNYGTTGSPDRQGFDYFYGYTDHRMCHTFFPPYLWRNGVQDPINDPGVLGHIRQPEGQVRAETYQGQKHASVAVREELLAYLDRQTNGAPPFFIYYCPLEPHVSMQPPPDWVAKYPAEWDPQPYRGDKGYVPHPRPRAGYAATISFLDDHVGQLLAKLAEKGLAANTLVVFTSDNGTTHDVGGVDHGFFNSVGELKGLKGSLYEGGIRVPALMRWPGRIPAGAVVDQPACSADLMPSLCALTGASAGQPYGENILPVMLGQKKQLTTRRPLVWTGGGYGGQTAVRFGDLKVLRRDLAPKAKNGPLNWEVYDLAADPHETTDLATSRRDVIDQAIALLRAEYQPAPDFPVLNLFAPEQAAETTEALPWAAIFTRLDGNADGRLTFEEWKESPRAQSSRAHQAEIFGELDRDADRTISKDEFAAQWK